MMSNPLFNVLNGNQQNAPNNMVEQFKQFRKEMSGKNPNEEINKLLRSGQISQHQLNEAQRMAQQFQMMLQNFK